MKVMEILIVHYYFFYIIFKRTNEDFFSFHLEKKQFSLGNFPYPVNAK